MSLKIAVAGKGGTGKTTVAALLLGAVLRRKLTPVLAVDADPNACLGEYLGVETPFTLGEVRDNVLEKKDAIPAGVSKAQVVMYESHKALVEEDGFDLVTMGRTEGPGCYCYVNTLLRGFMNELEENYRTVLMDNEAGMEHLSRRTSRDVDVLLVVADASRASRTAAARIVALVDELDIGAARRMIVFNRTDPDAGLPEAPAGLAAAGAVPPDEALADLDARGASLLALDAGSPSARAADDILARFLEESPE